MSLKDAKVLVTGGSNGIGEAIGKRFLEEGADVIVFDLEEPDYDAEYQEVDVKSAEQVKNGIQVIDQLDVLVNNAGIYGHTPVDEYEEDKIMEMIKTNFLGYRSMFTHSLDLLQQSEDGNVINISSALAEVPEPYSDIYSATKAAINAMSSAWANSYADTDVRVNTVLPGPVKTDMLFDNFSEEELDEYREKQPGKSFSEPEDIADIVIHYAKNETEDGAKYIQGEGSNNQYGL